MESQKWPLGFEEHAQQPPPPAYSEVDQGGAPSASHLGHPEARPYPTQAAPVLPPPPLEATMVTLQPSRGLSRQHNIMIIDARRPHVVIDGEHLPPFPTQLTCPCCRQLVNTRIEYRPGSSTHFAALLLCLFGCWPCCVLPYFMPSCQFPAHFCTNCQAFLGIAPHV